jgi:RNA polymerase sigma factor for flagellar operon FliA
MSASVKGKFNSKEELWQAWMQEKSIGYRNMLIDEYSTWCAKQAKNVFFKYPNSTLELSDYIHWATIGLIESIERYDPEKGERFENFAIFRVKGEILNNLSKVSDESAFASARSKILSERVGSLIDLSSGDDDFRSMLEFVKLFAIGSSIEELTNSSDSLEANNFDSDYLLTKHIDSILLLLSDNERIVVNYYYRNQLSFKEISKLLKVSKGRISQIHAEALSKLSKLISKDTLV